MDGSQKHLAGLFFSSLVKQQTSPELNHENGTPIERLTADDIRRVGPQAASGRGPVYASQPEIAFRHRHWHDDRLRVRKALLVSNHSRARVERFDNCGGECVVEVSADGSRHRLRATYCGDRWCQPCMAARAKKVSAQLVGWMHGKKLAFDCYTLRADGKSLKERLDHLLASFVRLRTCGWWKRNVQGGAATVQITRGRKKRHWHVHLHVIRTGPVWDRASQTAAWRKASKTSFIVDSEEVYSEQEAADYLARYASRGCERDVILSPSALVEAVVSLRGRRMLIPFGDWKRVEDRDEDEVKVEWKRVERFDRITDAARRGEAWALGVFASLKVKPRFDGVRVHFEDLEVSQDERRMKEPCHPSG